MTAEGNFENMISVSLNDSEGGIQCLHTGAWCHLRCPCISETSHSAGKETQSQGKTSSPQKQELESGAGYPRASNLALGNGV